MKKLICILLLGIASIQAFPQTTQVLFIGNSYTGVNNLPQLFSDLSFSVGDTVLVDTYYPGGYTFQMHTTDVNTLAKISSRPWDFVILQEQSQRPSFPPAQVALDVYPYARQLDSLIHLNNPCTETVFYMTWGRKYGDQSNCATWPPVCTYLGMQEELRNSYVQMANDNQALVAPIGRAWQSSWAQDSSINLWSTDNSHPSLEGSYLAAAVFYETIFRKSVVNAPFVSSVNSATALFLQQTAHQIVTDSLATWKVGAYDVSAQFSYSPTGLQVQFIDQSTNALNYFWDFGDGTTAVQPQPSHTYLQAGTFQVILITDNNCFSDTTVQFVSVVASGISAVPDNSHCINVNPSGEVDVLCGQWLSCSVYDVTGQCLHRQMMDSPRLNFIKKEWAPGIYLLIFKSSEGNSLPVRWRKNE